MALRRSSIAFSVACSRRYLGSKRNRRRNHSSAGPVDAAIADRRTRRPGPRSQSRRAIDRAHRLDALPGLAAEARPAFIASAPPTVPGMPAKNSDGPRPQRMHCRASCVHGTPAPARTPTCRSDRSSFAEERRSRRSRRRGMPPSRTSRLLPRPNQKTGVVVVELCEEMPAGHRRSAGTKNDRPVRRHATTCAGSSARLAQLALHAVDGLGAAIMSAPSAMAVPSLGQAAARRRCRRRPSSATGRRRRAGRAARAQLVERFDEHRLDPPARADGARNRAPVGAGDRRFAGRVDVE